MPSSNLAVVSTSGTPHIATSPAPTSTASGTTSGGPGNGEPGETGCSAAGGVGRIGLLSPPQADASSATTLTAPSRSGVRRNRAAEHRRELCARQRHTCPISTQKQSTPPPTASMARKRANSQPRAARHKRTAFRQASPIRRASATITPAERFRERVLFVVREADCKARLSLVQDCAAASRSKLSSSTPKSTPIGNVNMGVGGWECVGIWDLELGI